MKLMLRSALVTSAVAILLQGCANAPSLSSAWRVEPLFKVSDSRPAAQPGYLALARLYQSEGRDQQAIEALRKAIAMTPSDTDALNALGLALAKQGQVGEAVDVLKLAVAEMPSDARLLNNVGYALQLDGQLESAHQMYLAALAIDPAYEKAQVNLAQLDTTFASLQNLGSNPVAAAMPTTTARMVIQSTPNLQPMPLVSSSEGASSIQLKGAMTLAGYDSKDALSSGGVSLTKSTVDVLNGNGVSGAAAGMRAWLNKHGVQTHRVANLKRYNLKYTRVVFRAGHEQEAIALAKLLPKTTVLVRAKAKDHMQSDVRVLVGHDMDKTLAIKPSKNRLAHKKTPAVLASSAQ